jgi:hypothetical protein
MVAAPAAVVPTVVPAAVPSAAAAPAIAVAPAVVPIPVAPAVVEPQPRVLSFEDALRQMFPNGGKAKVKFITELGSITHVFCDVRVNGIFLVLLQVALPEDLFEAPSGKSAMAVECGGQRYTCFAGLQFPILTLNSGAQLHATVYFIQTGPAAGV